MARRSRVGSQLANPTGWRGRIVAREMERFHRRMVDSAVELLAVSSGDTSLDIGFGGGRSLGLLADRAAPAKVTGIDQSPTMVAMARRRHRRAIRAGAIDIVDGSVDDMPFGEATFDRVLSVNCLPYWPDPKAGLAEIARVVAPGGRVVISVRPPGTMQALAPGACTFPDAEAFAELCRGTLNHEDTITGDDRLGGWLHFVVSR
jgi:SAM-dependent methyltransferase